MSARTKAAINLQGRRVGHARHLLLPVAPAPCGRRSPPRWNGRA
jgi:hypothetical protein